ncbi:MAG: ATPase, T2SS/T4P/T4SS family [Planctomycetota bacterium]
MILWQRNKYSEERAAHRITGHHAVIGRANTCDIRLPSALVADEAVSLHRSGHDWKLTVLAMNGCQVGDRNVARTRELGLQDGCEIELDPYVLTVDLSEQIVSAQVADDRQLDEAIADLIRTIHVQLLDGFPRSETDKASEHGGEHLLRLEKAIDEFAVENGLGAEQQTPLLRRLAGHAVRNAIIDHIIGGNANADPLFASQRKWVALASAGEEREVELRQLASKVERMLGFSTDQKVQERMSTLDEHFWSCWTNRINLVQEFFEYLAKHEIKKQVKDLIFGYGPIEDLLRLPTVSEIMVTGHDQIYVEKREKSGGTIENSGRRFVSEEATLGVIRRIVSRCDRRIDKSEPLVDARLDDGSRVNAVIPPISVSGPTLTIRRFPERRYQIEDWIESGGLSPIVAQFLDAAVRARRNIMIAGGTGAGKTTLLNCMTDWIPDRQRIITIEDTAELQLIHDHVVSMQTRPANADGSGAVTTRDLVRNALRMRPDRVIVGECRGGEALDMLNAMNTGHAGSMTTLHANSPSEVPNRLESMVKMGADFSEKAIHQQIASAIDLIIQVAHRSDPDEKNKKRRFVSCVSEIRAIDPYTERVQVVDLYAIPSGSEDHQLRPTGHLPTFSAELADAGLFDLSAFCPELLEREAQTC